MPPTPSSLYLFRLKGSGTTPAISAPVESCRYLPTTSLLLASPLGCLEDFEFNNNLALSQALAARITVRPVTWYSCISSLLMYEMPEARPSFSVITSRAIAFVIKSIFPVSSAGMTRQEEAEKSPYTLQLRPHCAQKKHAPLSLFICLVRMESLEGITGTPTRLPAFFMKSSCSLGLGGGRKIPSGSLNNPSLVPKTPSIRSILS